MDNFAPILEKALAVKEFDYSDKSKRILNFGSSVHGPTKDNPSSHELTWGLDLDTLTADDLEILLNPEYLSYAWEAKDPIQRKDRLIEIINKHEKNLDRKSGVEEGFDSIGERLLYHRGPPEHHDTRRITTANGETIDNPEPHSSGSSSFKSFLSKDIDTSGVIKLEMPQFQEVLGKLHDADEDYTFKNLSDNYLRSVSETNTARDIEPEDIEYDEQEEFAVPNVIDDTPVEISDIDDVPDAEEVEEPEVDSEFEPEEPELKPPEAKPEIKPPEIKAPIKPPEKIKPEVKPPAIKPEIPEPTPKIPEVLPEPIEEPPTTELAPDIETAITRRLEPEPRPAPKKFISAEEGDMDDNLDKSAAKNEIDNMPGTAKAAKEDIEESITKSLLLAGLL